MGGSTEASAASKAVNPVWRSAESGKPPYLEALEVQELTSIDEDGDPVLHKISQDSAVVISGEEEKDPPFYAFVRKVHWDESSKSASVTVQVLLRASQIDKASKEKFARAPLVYLGSREVTLPAWRIMHPCRVFFLQIADQPFAMLKLNGKKQQGLRFGLICCALFDEDKKFCQPFCSFPKSAPFFNEVVKLLQKTNKELRAQEAREELPLKSRTAPLNGNFGPLQIQGTEPPKSGSRVTQHSSLSRGVPPNTFKSQKLASNNQSTVKPSGLGLKTGLDTKKSKKMETEAVSKNKTSSEANEISKDKKVKSIQVKEKPSESGQKSQGKRKRDESEIGGERKGKKVEKANALEPDSSKGKQENEAQNEALKQTVNQVANELAMTLELGGFESSAAFKNIEASLRTLISHAGPLGEKVKNLSSFKFRASDIQKISVLKLHAWRQKICMPDIHVVKRLAQAVLSISQESKHKLLKLGLLRLMGTYLHGTQIPPDSENVPTSVIPLLKAISIKKLDKRNLIWLEQNRVMTHLEALCDSANSNVHQASDLAKIALHDGIADLYKELIERAETAIARTQKKICEREETGELGSSESSSEFDDSSETEDSRDNEPLSHRLTRLSTEPPEFQEREPEEEKSGQEGEKEFDQAEKPFEEFVYPDMPYETGLDDMRSLSPTSTEEEGKEESREPSKASSLMAQKRFSFPETTSGKSDKSGTKCRNIDEVTRKAPRGFPSEMQKQELSQNQFESLARAKKALANPSPSVSALDTHSPSVSVGLLDKKDQPQGTEKHFMPSHHDEKMRSTSLPTSSMQENQDNEKSGVSKIRDSPEHTEDSSEKSRGLQGRTGSHNLQSNEADLQKEVSKDKSESSKKDRDSTSNDVHEEISGQKSEPDSVIMLDSETSPINVINEKLSKDENHTGPGQKSFSQTKMENAAPSKSERKGKSQKKEVDKKKRKANESEIENSRIAKLSNSDIIPDTSEEDVRKSVKRRKKSPSVKDDSKLRDDSSLRLEGHSKLATPLHSENLTKANLPRNSKKKKLRETVESSIGKTEFSSKKKQALEKDQRNLKPTEGSKSIKASKDKEKEANRESSLGTSLSARSKSLGKAMETESNDGHSVGVYAGEGSDTIFGTYNSETKKIRLLNGKVVDLKNFCRMANCEGNWRDHIIVKAEDESSEQKLDEWIKYKCKVCGRPDNADIMLMCENVDCEQLYHIHCLTPPLDEVPEGTWYCQKCSALGFS